MRSQVLASIGLVSSTIASGLLRSPPPVMGRDFIALDKRASQTAPWVEVDDEQQPVATHTPSMTIVDGTTSIENAAPHDLTATVFTFTEWGKIHTSTGEPPNPMPTGKNGDGAFTRCYNMDGENAPFCDPAANSTLILDKTYYVTWDPDYFNKTQDNTTYIVTPRLDIWNATSKEWEKESDFDYIPATFGFWPFKVKGKYLKSKGGPQHNISITLYSSRNNSAEKTKASTLYLNLAKPSGPEKSVPSVPTGHTLTIALPAVLGAIALLLVGGCIWNRKTRHIGIGNIMARHRGYTGRKTRRMLRSKDDGIQLDTRHISPLGAYRDAPPLSRRDSDGLASLVNSPVEPSFSQQDANGGRNVFRDEIRRQEQERSW